MDLGYNTGPHIDAFHAKAEASVHQFREGYDE
jgi:hypothetical protein